MWKILQDAGLQMNQFGRIALVHGAPYLRVASDVNQIDLYSQATILLGDAAVTTAATSSSRPASFGLTADPL